MTEHRHSAHNTTQTTVLGFWLYILSDCVLFATLFATYAILQKSTAHAPAGAELFSLPFVLTETLILLTSSFTAGLAILSTHHGKVRSVIFWCLLTFALGAAFVFLEVQEFMHLVREGHGPSESAFLSSFFTLVGTHGAHVSAGLLWVVVLMVQLSMWGITPMTLRRMMCWSLFWHFLDIVWIFIFTIVYLMSAL